VSIVFIFLYCEDFPVGSGEVASEYPTPGSVSMRTETVHNLLDLGAQAVDQLL